MMEFSVKDIRKSYGEKQVLKGISFSAISGDLILLEAPSGSGKTTLLRILSGLEHGDSGEMSGFDKAKLSVVFQEDRLLEHTTAEGNLRFVLGKQYNADKAEALFRELDLPEWNSKPVEDFSGGMKRRAAIARALSVPFDVLILDEPFTGLDDAHRLEAEACIKRHSENALVILVTHQTNTMKVTKVVRL